MRSTSRAFCITTALSAALLGICATPAHAGMLGFMDRAFTFREEQKPLVAPTTTSTPRHVIQPSYNPADHVAWSQFYTRKDLTAQDYLSSSASKVMRERPEEQAPQQAAGWDAINQRAAINAADTAREEGGAIFIGEAGNGPGVQASTANVGRETVIGSAKNDWRDGPSGSGLNSRPGDFDYRLPDSDRGPLEIDGTMLSESLPSKNYGAATESRVVTDALRNDPRYAEFNDDGQVTKYVVQPGDTLGGIASQREIYDKASLWPLIYSANRKEIGGKPSNLKTKQQLTIPRDYTEQQAKDAEKRAGKR